MAKTTEKTGLAKIPEFYSDTKAELKKVFFPSREESIRWTIVVIAMMFLFSFFLGLSDFFVGRLMTSILG